MQEFDLHKLWDDANADADQWYQQRRQELLAQAQQRSASILQKLRRQFLWETLLSLALGAIVIAWFFQPVSWIFWGIVLFWLASTLLFVRIYYQFRQDIARLPLLDVKASTAGFLRLLREHGQRLVRLYWVLGPLGLIFGYFVGFLEGSANNYAALQDWRFWAISIPALALTGWLFTYYGRWRYQRAIGRREIELEEILESLGEHS
jgi:hypothetical protein